MTYFRVKDRCDGERVVSQKREWVELIGGELLTASEVQRNNVPSYMLDKVSIPSKRVYYSFGVRFAY